MNIGNFLLFYRLEPMASNSRIQLEQYLKTIDVAGSVLDIGGSQAPIKGRTKTWNPTIYDISDIKHPHHEKRKADLVFDLNEKNMFGKRKYDTIFCIEVMEYVWNPAAAAENIFKLLNDGGVAYISFHYLYGLHPPKGEDCLRYSRNAIEKIWAKFRKREYSSRQLTKDGKRLLEQFYLSEGMRLDYSDPEVYQEGYIVKMTR